MKSLLDVQDKAYKNALELFMNQVDKKFQAFQTTINEVTKSLEFTQSELDEEKFEVKQLHRARKEDQDLIRRLSDELQEKSVLIKDLEERYNYQEDYNRRNNLQIMGVEENQQETWEQTALKVTELLDKKMQLPNMEIERAHRVGQRTETRHRPIIARFTKFCDREAVLRNAAKLRGTRIFIHEDLCQASQNIRKEKLPLLKEARSEGKIAYFRHTKLIIKERQESRRMDRAAGDGEQHRTVGSFAAAVSSPGSLLRSLSPPGAAGADTADGPLHSEASSGSAGEQLRSAGSLAAAASGAGELPQSLSLLGAEGAAAAGGSLHAGASADTAGDASGVVGDEVSTRNVTQGHGTRRNTRKGKMI